MTDLFLIGLFIVLGVPALSFWFYVMVKLATHAVLNAKAKFESDRSNINRGE